MMSPRRSKIWIFPEWPAPWNEAWVAAFTGTLPCTDPHPETLAEIIPSSVAARNGSLNAACEDLDWWLHNMYQDGDVLICGLTDEVFQRVPLSWRDSKMRVIAHVHSTASIPFNSDQTDDPDGMKLAAALGAFSQVDTWYTANHLLVGEWLACAPVFATGFPYYPLFGWEDRKARFMPADEQHPIWPSDVWGFKRGLCTEDVPIVIAGRAHPTKQLELAAWLAVQAGEILSSNGYLPTYTLCTPPGYFFDANSFIRMLEFRHKFKVVNTRQGYYSALGSAKFYLTAAMSEFFPLTPIDAMYAGALPIMPRTSVFPELYPPEMLYDPYSAKDVAGAMSLYLLNDERVYIPKKVEHYHMPQLVRSRFHDLFTARLAGVTWQEFVGRSRTLVHSMTTPMGYEWVDHG